jgi:predicted small metal-binding protein
MLRVSCSDLTTECATTLDGVSVNHLVLQYVMHAAHAHRDEAVRLDDLFAAMKPLERRSLADGWAA